MKTWLIEDNQSMDVLCEYLDKENLPYKKMGKFDSLKYEDLSTQFNEPDIFCGSLFTMKKLKKLGWKCIWYDDYSFSVVCQLEHYRPYLMNKACLSVRVDSLHDPMVKSVIFSQYGKSGSVFIRPDKGDKPFSGALVDETNYDNDVSYIQSRGSSKPSDLVFISEPYGIDQEWRCVIVNGKVVSSSQYKRNDKLELLTGCPEEVKVLAEKLAAMWQPYPVFVLDVCKSGDELCCMEINSFNSSGYYACDIGKIVEAINLL